MSEFEREIIGDNVRFAVSVEYETDTYLLREELESLEECDDIVFEMKGGRDTPKMSASHIDKAGYDEHNLYAYIHGGVALSLGSFSCPWDSGQVGHVYVKVGIGISEEMVQRRVKLLERLINNDAYHVKVEKYSRARGECEGGESEDWEYEYAESMSCVMEEDIESVIADVVVEMGGYFCKS